MKRKSQEPKAAKAVKALIPRSPDTKYLGDETVWANMPAPDSRNAAQIRSFAWYNYYCDAKDARQFVIDWMSRNDFSATDTRKVAQVLDRGITTTLGWLCRMATMGWILNDRENRYIADNIQRLLQLNTNENIEPEQQPKTSKPTIQDHIREKMLEAGGEIEGMFDTMIADGCKLNANHRPVDVLRRFNVAPQLISDISNHWVNVADEFKKAAQGNDQILAEGYRGRSKIQMRNMIRFAEQVVADCASYVQVKKVERKPRKKKPVSPEKLTARFKYLREFAELGLKSAPVTGLVNAQEAWLYDTKRRKLIHVLPEALVGSFSVKGSSLIGFDATQSVRKTLRKPREQIKALMAAGAPAARKLFKEIKGTETKFNGRGNADIIILRVR